MATDRKTFLIEMYEEHLEESSFLYEQRCLLLDDPEIPWPDLEDHEERFEAHIDGLVLGDSLAIDVCKRQVVEGDYGELHAALRVFCRHKRKDLVLEIVDSVDLADEERVQAISDALSQELPAEWESEFVHSIEHSDRRLAAMARVIGDRRLDTGPALANLLGTGREQPLLARMLWMTGRVGARDARGALNRLLQEGDDSTRAAAALALMRLGDPQVLGVCMQQARMESWPCIPLGLGGTPDAVAVLRDRITKAADEDCVIALGLLGDVSAVPILVSLLETEDLASPAALALSLISGRVIYEEVFVPDEIDEDELLDGEHEKLQKGEIPKGAEGRPRGRTITRLSLDPGFWSGWWAENRSTLKGTLRYRNGAPYSLEGLLENLRAPRTPHGIRSMASEEMVIRYGLNVPFERDQFVREQKKRLAEIGEWVTSNGRRFQDGSWYVGGRFLA